MFPGQEKKVYELIYQDVQLLRQKIIQMENKLEQNQTEIQSIKDYLAEMLKLIQIINREQAELGAEQKKIPAQYQLLLEKLDGMSDQFARMSEDLLVLKSAAFPAEGQEAGEIDENLPPSKEAAQESELSETGEEDLFPIAPDLSPREVYDMAYSDFRKGNFLLAIEGFSIYLEQFPDSPLADNAKYWIGECFFSQEKYSEAIDHFNELFINFPQSDTLPAAYLKKGLSLIELDKKEEALSVFKLLITKYPLEDEARIAQEKIKELEDINA
jgi:tol-pal system protein YbgF